MRYTNEQYAEALFRAANGKAAAKQKEILRNFLLLLSRKGDFYRLPLVVQKFEKKYRAYNGVNKVRIEYPDGIVADVVNPALEKDTIVHTNHKTNNIPQVLFKGVVKKQIENILGKKIVWEEKINPALLGGIKIIVNDYILIDASAKRQLDRIMPRSKI